MAIEFKKATRGTVKLKVGVSGASGSGKTWGALELARGLVGPQGTIALVDTENESAALYSDRFDFSQLVMHPPFTVAKFCDAIDAAVAQGFQVLVLDSISHEWDAEGGILDKKNQIDLRGRAGSKGEKNNYTNWAEPSADHARFVAKIVQAPIHIIATMRSKMDYEIIDGKPKKLGLAPIQRPGTEYEFTVVFDVAMNHEAVASKDRTSLFEAKHFRLSQAIGAELRGWLTTAPAPVAFPAANPTLAKIDQIIANASPSPADAGATPVPGSPAPPPPGQGAPAGDGEVHPFGQSPFHEPEFGFDETPEQRFSKVAFSSGTMSGQFISAAPTQVLLRAKPWLQKMVTESHENLRPMFARQLAAVEFYLDKHSVGQS